MCVHVFLCCSCILCTFGVHNVAVTKEREKEGGREERAGKRECLQIKPSVGSNDDERFSCCTSTTILISSPSLPNVTKKVPQNAGKLYLHGKCATPMHIQCTTGWFS